MSARTPLILLLSGALFACTLQDTTQEDCVCAQAMQPTSEAALTSISQIRCQDQASDAKVNLSFDSTPLGEAARIVSAATCYNLIVEENVRDRKITMFSPHPLPREEFYQGFEAALSANGLSLLPAGEFLMIVAARDIPPPRPRPLVVEAEEDASSELATWKGITKTGDYSYTVERASVEEWLADPATLAKQARMIPHIKEGKIHGFKVYGVRPSSLLAQLGLKNGDVVHAIDGEALTDLNRAVTLFERLKKASRVEVEINRRGQSLTLAYLIQ